MGRRNDHPSDPSRPVRLRLARIRWTDECYDQGGAYWGMGNPIFCAYGRNPDGSPIRLYIRARDRVTAIAAILSNLAPGSTVAGYRSRFPGDLEPANLATSKAQSSACKARIASLDSVLKP